MQLLEWKTESGPKYTAGYMPLAMRTVVLILGGLIGHICFGGLAVLVFSACKR